VYFDSGGADRSGGKRALRPSYIDLSMHRQHNGQSPELC